MKSAAPDALRVEYRCPRWGRLFAVAVLTEIPDGGVIEVACPRCKQSMVRNGQPVERVIHRYALSGIFVTTLTLPSRQGDGIGSQMNNSSGGAVTAT